MNVGSLTCDLGCCSVELEALWNVLLIEQRVEAAAAFCFVSVMEQGELSGVWTGKE